MMKMHSGNKTIFRKRCIRYNEPGHAHELTFCCYRRQPFLKSTRISDSLVHAIHEARVKHQFDLWAYVFMPDHVHLLICPRNEEYCISKILRSIKQSVSRKALLYLKKYNPSGLEKLSTGKGSVLYRFWQAGGGYDRNIVIDETLIKVVRYIHQNPVRAGMADDSLEWTHSSAKDWEKEGTGPLQLNLEPWPFF